jgi:hypothetical protein
MSRVLGAENDAKTDSGLKTRNVEVVYYVCIVSVPVLTTEAPPD